MKKSTPDPEMTNELTQCLRMGKSIRLFELIKFRQRIFSLNLFTPEFLKWTLPSPNLDKFIVANRGLCQNSITELQTV